MTVTASRLKILLSGMIASNPYQGGATWAVLQYLLGLKNLGHEVFFVEPIADESLRPARSPLASSENAAYFRAVAGEFGLAKSAALLLAGTEETVGGSYEQLRRAASRADLLINVAGMLGDQSLTESIPVRVYLDLDPAFVQLWHDAEGIDMRFDGHTHFVSVGQFVGQPGCTVPTCGLEWIKTLQPVVLELWPVNERVSYDGLTTIANWRGYGSIEHGGVFYGQKAHSLRQFIDLPTLTEEKFFLALSIHPEETRDLEALRSHGWNLLDPARVAGSPAAYRQFIGESRGEFGVAKSGYVNSRCGWFSDRSVCYLASGKPVVAQETGFSEFLPTGEGLFAFETSEDVLAAIQSVNTCYAQHAAASRALAEEYFAADRVLPRLLRNVGVAP